jgi:hypothetical protein
LREISQLADREEVNMKKVNTKKVLIGVAAGVGLFALVLTAERLSEKAELRGNRNA